MIYIQPNKLPVMLNINIANSKLPIAAGLVNISFVFVFAYICICTSCTLLYDLYGYSSIWPGHGFYLYFQFSMDICICISYWLQSVINPTLSQARASWRLICIQTGDYSMLGATCYRSQLHLNKKEFIECRLTYERREEEKLPLRMFSLYFHKWFFLLYFLQVNVFRWFCRTSCFEFCIRNCSLCIQF